MILFFAFFWVGAQWSVYSFIHLPLSQSRTDLLTFTSPATMLFCRRRHARSSKMKIDAKFVASDLDKADKKVFKENLTEAMKSAKTVFENFSYNLDPQYEEQVASCKSRIFIAYLPLCLYFSLSPSLQKFSDKVNFFLVFYGVLFSVHAPQYSFCFLVAPNSLFEMNKVKPAFRTGENGEWVFKQVRLESCWQHQCCSLLQSQPLRVTCATARKPRDSVEWSTPVLEAFASICVKTPTAGATASATSTSSTAKSPPNASMSTQWMSTLSDRWRARWHGQPPEARWMAVIAVS